MLHRHEVVTALKKTDMPILKLDSAIDTTLELINQPSKKVFVNRLIEQLQLLGNQCIVQTMFLRGTCCGQTVDNTTPAELDAWEHAVAAIRPKSATIYTIARKTPFDTLYKVSGDTLREIAARIQKHNIAVQISE
jgi:wyosine [tRNA(Phe)-imidazoG37] synthetase (radical SAM superfamily)